MSVLGSLFMSRVNACICVNRDQDIECFELDVKNKSTIEKEHDLR